MLNKEIEVREAAKLLSQSISLLNNPLSCDFCKEKARDTMASARVALEGLTEEKKT